MIPILEVIEAAFEPLTRWEAWYGVWFALALRKEMRKTIGKVGELARKRIENAKGKGDSDGG